LISKHQGGDHLRGTGLDEWLTINWGSKEQDARASPGSRKGPNVSYVIFLVTRT
jgi:hypothetical protein